MEYRRDHVYVHHVNIQHLLINLADILLMVRGAKRTSEDEVFFQVAESEALPFDFR